MQQRTNRTLQAILLLALGFSLGMVTIMLLGIWNLAG
jgi:hypothetical protein